MRVFPVSQHTPGQVLSKLIEEHGADFIPTVLPIGKRLTFTGKYRDVIFILSSEDFARNVTATRKLDHDFYVFGTPSVFRQYNLRPIDERGTLDLSVSPQRPRPAPRSTYVDELIELSKAGSLFDDLMTAIYSLPSKTHQRPVTRVCCLWLYNGGTADDLVAMLKAIPDIKVKQSQIDLMTHTMQKPITRSLQKALAAYRSSPALGISHYSVVYGVQKFEMSYVIGNVEKKDTLIDKYVANQGGDA